MKRFPWFETLLVVAVMSVGLYAAFSDAQNFSQRWFIRDDAYYYFKVAQNVSEGHGSTFDGFNPTNGYHPLWMVVCIPIFALARFDLILPLRVLLLVMSGLSATTGILLYRLLGKALTPFIGALAALYWVFDVTVLKVVYQQGLETGIAAFFIVLFLYKLHPFETSANGTSDTTRPLIGLGLIAALMFFSRLDLVFLAGLAGVWIVFRGRALRVYLLLDLLAVLCSALFSFLFRLGFPAYYDFSDSAILMAGAALLVRIPLAYLLGLYTTRSRLRSLRDLTPLLLFAFIGSALTSLLTLALTRLMGMTFPRTVLLLDPVLSTVFVGLIRLLVALPDGPDTQPSSSPRPTPLRDLQIHWRTWLREGFTYYGTAYGLLAIYMLWNKLALGTFSPVSGQIKRWWGSFSGRVYGGAARDTLSFFGLDFKDGGGAWQPLSGLLGRWAESLSLPGLKDTTTYILIVLLFLLACALLLRTRQAENGAALAKLSLLPLAVGAILQPVSYHISGYAAEQNWYWVTQWLALVLFFSVLLGALARFIPETPLKHYVTWGLVTIVAVQMVGAYWTTVRLTMPYGYWKPDDPLLDTLPLLEGNTEPGSIIGFTGGGNVGYFIHDRTVVNMDGLINSYPYFQALQQGTAGKFLLDLGMDYVFVNPNLLSGLPYNKQFDAYVTPTGITYGGKELLKYGAPP